MSSLENQTIICRYYRYAHTGLSNEQERLLDAVQRQEDETQEKLGEERKAIYIPGKKNW